MARENVTIGVLALQGGFSEHIAMLQSLTPSAPITVIPIRTSAQLSNISALIIPGGESTTMSIILQQSELLKDLREFVNEARMGKGRKAVWGTCAGMILLGEEVLGSKEGYEGLGGVDMKVVRNQWGRQSESFEHGLSIPCLIDPTTPYKAVFIRAPVVHSLLPQSPNSPSLEILAKVPREILPVPKESISPSSGKVMEPTELGPDADCVMMRQGGLVVSSFHPELTNDSRVHEWFVREMVL